MSGKFALIIGNTEYTDPGLAQLTAPGKDAEDFARVLKDQDICGFDNVSILLNQPSSAVSEAIDEFLDQKKPDDLIVLYFSGHGVRDELGALYLAVRNTNRFRLRSTAIKSDFIRDAMDQSRSKRQVLILDCCNSGAFAQGTKAATGVSIGTATAFEAGYGRVILTASDSTQFAWEGDKVIGDTDNSLFTHFLVQGLEGEADLDGDGHITVDELYDYAYEKVKLATPKQTPSKFSSKQQGEIVLRQSMRIEDIKPVTLPDELIEATEDSRTFVREGAVQQLGKLLMGRNLGLARSAREALERIEKEDDSRRVSQAATQVLEPIRQAEKVEEERKAREEAERIALEKAQAERKAKQEAERLLAEQQAEEERKAKKEAKRLAALKAKKEERLAREKAEAEQRAKEEADRLLAVQMADEERSAREEAERLAFLKAEEERLAREKAEGLSAEKKAEEERIAKEELEAERLAEEKANAARKAREETELLAEEKRLVTEKAVVVSEKIVRPQPIPQPQSILKWVIIGIIGLCIIATGAWGIPYLASLIIPPATPATTEPPATEPPAAETLPTEAPSATEIPSSPTSISSTSLPPLSDIIGAYSCNNDICLADYFGKPIKTFELGLSFGPMWISWSPTGTYLLFGSNLAGLNEFGSSELYTLDVRTGDLQQLTNNGSADEFPVWSPDGRKIAFVSTRNGGTDPFGNPFVMNADGSNQLQLSDQYTQNVSWFSDELISFVNNNGLYLINTDGTNQKLLISGDIWDAERSPNGKWIAYFENCQNDCETFITDENGQNKRPLLTDSGWSAYPNWPILWSPNSEYIALQVQLDDGNHEVFAVEVDSGASKNVSNYSGDDLLLGWSPRDGQIVFYSARDPTGTYVVQPDGSHTRFLAPIAQAYWGDISP